VAEYHSYLGPYVVGWLDSATHVDVFGISIDRPAAERSLTKIAERKDSALPGINLAYARGAVTRAIRNGSAIAGSHILWVDGHPDNNQDEANILNDIGIDVRRATNTKDALTILPSYQPDLIISNVVRDGDEHIALKNCPAHYFEVPAGLPIDLPELNSETMAGTGKATGFSMAEAISNIAALAAYTDHDQPRIIFYSASNGGIAASQCARSVINRADLLLQSVISGIEELKWGKLQVSNQN
jgi:CheY-like chemotaxis protein